MPSHSEGADGGREQKAGAPASPAAEGVEAIDREFQRDLIQLERRRLERLAELAARQPKVEAEKTYEVYLSSAAGRELFKEAEPIAEKVLKDGDASPRVLYLAHAVNIIAEVRRGDFEASLAIAEAACRSARHSARRIGRCRRCPWPNGWPSSSFTTNR